MSVVIPVFNRAAAVRRAIASVQAQTVQDFEIIVVDDASTDGTADAVTSITDARITLLRHDQNRGGSAARNTGIRASRAAYIAFLDSDDEWLPTKLQRQLDVFAGGDRTVAMVYAGYERRLADGSRLMHVPRPCSNLAQTLLTDNVIGGSSVAMVRKDACDVVGGFDEALPAVQDLDFWLRICVRFPAAFVPEILARVWQVGGPGRVSADVAATIKARQLFYRKHEPALKQHQVAHVFLNDIGWMYHRAARDARSARRFYLQAIASQRLAVAAYLLLMATYLPLSLLDWAANCKHWLTGLLVPRERTVSTESESRDTASAGLDTTATRDSAA